MTAKRQITFNIGIYTVGSHNNYRNKILNTHA